ncbi:thiamine biosynthesis protein [Pseudonocardiaceae bacterium YIM PH 21723]|nr:thiamine biosynthesis protein [Pseudonocardiaceae bacterium YIM PH 21723]
MLTVSGCADTQQNAGAEKVTYLTSFNTFGRDSYAYVAQEKGYFRDAGLEVTINPGTGTADVLKFVAGGRAEFGTADFTGSVISIAKDKLPVTTVAMVHQKTLAALVSLSDKGIKKPADLVGKQIADAPGSTMRLMFPMYAKKAGFDPGSVQFVPSAPPSLPQLLASGKVDSIGQFTVGVPLIEKAVQGRKIATLPYGDVLPDLYGNALVTSKDLAAKKPEQVAKFKAALLKGLKYAVEHPDEAGQILRKFQPTQDAEVAAAELKLMAPSVLVPGTEVGAADQARVKRTIELLTSAGAISAGSITPGDLVADLPSK